jgi:predicted dehydrogenase
MEACELGRKWLVDDKAIGKLTQLHMRIWGNVTPGGKYFETPWRKAPGYQGGFVLDGGVHHIALIRYVSGEEIVETQGFSRQVAKYLPPIDTVNTGILLSGGGTGTVSISFSSALGGNEYSFIGEKGSLVITGSKDGNVLKLDVDGDKKEETVKSYGILNEIKAFLEAARSGKGQDRAGPEEALNDLAFIESVCQGFGKVKNW